MQLSIYYFTRVATEGVIACASFGTPDAGGFIERASGDLVSTLIDERVFVE